MAEEIRESEIICPYCKSVWQDSWEYKEESNEDFECDDCGKKFMWRRNIDVDYICSPDCELNNEKHEFPEFGHVIEKSNKEGYFKCRHCIKCNEFESIDTDKDGNKI